MRIVFIDYSAESNTTPASNAPETLLSSFSYFSPPHTHTQTSCSQIKTLATFQQTTNQPIRCAACSAGVKMVNTSTWVGQRQTKATPTPLQDNDAPVERGSHCYYTYGLEEEQMWTSHTQTDTQVRNTQTMNFFHLGNYGVVRPLTENIWMDGFSAWRRSNTAEHVFMLFK